VVRHPQYLAGVLMSLASVLISQHWLNAVLLFPVAVGFYLDSLRADRRLIEKFGHRYEEYMERVSGLNPLKGILGILSARGKSI
jgi:protein-S-isoprenylcysteine O-methyltransferase Ste14